MAKMDTKSLILCMIGLEKDHLTGELGGITRLQKLLYLLENEDGIEVSNGGFEFKPYKAGPCSAKLYDDLEFLENLGYIESEIVGDSTEAEVAEVDALNFEDLIENDKNDEPVGPGDAYVERSFKLTKKGKKKVEDLLRSNEYIPFVKQIRKIKSKFGNYALKDILYYVYRKYPDMTIKSDIRDRVLGRRGA